MRMTYASFMKFNENIDMSMLWSICRRGGRKNGATAVKRKWCHSNISVPIAHGDTGAKEVGVSVSCKMVGCSRLPGSHGLVVWKRGTCKDLSRTRCKHEHLIQHMHSFHGRHLGVIPSKRAFGAERVRSGSSCSRDGGGSSGTCFRSRTHSIDVRVHGEDLDVHGDFKGQR